MTGELVDRLVSGVVEWWKNRSAGRLVGGFLVGGLVGSCLEGCQGGGVAPCRVIHWLVVIELVSGVMA